MRIDINTWYDQNCPTNKSRGHCGTMCGIYQDEDCLESLEVLEVLTDKDDIKNHYDMYPLDVNKL